MNDEEDNYVICEHGSLPTTYLHIMMTRDIDLWWNTKTYLSDKDMDNQNPF